jgi:hypothetical protein
MASEDVQTNLRLPADLKERLIAAADHYGRSLSAEVVYRLEESFQARRTDVIVFEQMMEQRIEGLNTRIEMLDLRIDMARARMDSAKMRGRLAKRETELLALQPSNAENDATLKAVRAEIGLADADLKALNSDLRRLAKAREAVLADIEETRAAMADGGGALERLAEEREARP